MASIIGQLCFYRALKLGEVSRVVPIGASYPVLAFILGTLFLGESINVAKVGGIVLVALALVLLWQWLAEHEQQIKERWQRFRQRPTLRHTTSALRSTNRVAPPASVAGRIFQSAARCRRAALRGSRLGPRRHYAGCHRGRCARRCGRRRRLARPVLRCRHYAMATTKAEAFELAVVQRASSSVGWIKRSPNECPLLAVSGRP